MRCEDPRKTVEVLKIPQGAKNNVITFLLFWGQKVLPG